MQRVQIDPFDGKPLRYLLRGDGVIVYSIGPDAKDDGGDLRRIVSPNGEVDENGPWATSDLNAGDIGFQLWNVQERRKAAK